MFLSFFLKLQERAFQQSAYICTFFHINKVTGLSNFSFLYAADFLLLYYPRETKAALVTGRPRGRDEVLLPFSNFLNILTKISIFLMK